MKYIDEYRNKDLVKATIHRIKQISQKPVTFMEVCGGHTMVIQKFGIPAMLPENIRLISGPGCPVCVTGTHFIDRAIAYSRLDDLIIATFGDLIRVPGSRSSLNKEKASGADVRIVYSPLDALKLAKENPQKKVIFLAIGFETTAPGTAVTIEEARKSGVKNFFVLSAHKVMPPAMEALSDEGVKINGYIAPGHVSTITGADIYRFIPEKFSIPVVISGFEPLDLLQSILMLVRQVEAGHAKVETQYKRVVRQEGNRKAQQILNKVFQLEDARWRGLGTIPSSGLGIRPEYQEYDAFKMIPIEVPHVEENKNCICGEILKGLKEPQDCKLFGKACTPENPVGACMVSNEGACQACFRYKNYD